MQRCAVTLDQGRLRTPRVIAGAGTAGISEFSPYEKPRRSPDTWLPFSQHFHKTFRADDGILFGEILANRKGKLFAMSRVRGE